MRIQFIAGASMLAFASPALAQQAQQPSDADSGQLDTLVPADDQPAQPAPPKPTGDAVLDRLNALEARVNQLEAENVGSRSSSTKAASGRSKRAPRKTRSSAGRRPSPIPTATSPSNRAA
jgi:phosphate-selective porin OprO/OprP